MKTLIKKTFFNWIIDNEYLYRLITKQNKNPKYYVSNRKELTNMVIEDLLNNKSYFKYIISFCKNNYYYNENFKFLYDKSEQPILINLTNKKIISFLLEHQDLLKSSWHKKYLNKLVEYSSNKHFEKNVLEKYKLNGISYSKILELIKKDPEELAKSNFYNLNLEEVYELLVGKPFCLGSKNRPSSITSILKFTEEELANIETNFLKLKYDYELDYPEKETFVSNDDLINSFNINENLKNEILQEIPSHFSNIQKAYYIYRRLCQKFSYDPDYYIHSMYNDTNSKINHYDIKRLESLHGNEDIICGEISLVYAKFLSFFDIPCQLLDSDDKEMKELSQKHMKARLKIDGFMIDADIAYGIYDSDLSTEKSLGEIKRFKLLNTSDRYRNKFNQEIKEVDKYINDNIINLEYDDAIRIYKSISKTNSINNTNVFERVQLLEKTIVENKLDFINIMVWTKAIKEHLLGDKDTCCKLEFIANTNPTGDKKDLELAALVIYNNNDIEQLNETYQYDIITEDKKIEHIEFSELKDRFNKGIYFLTDPSRKLPGIVDGDNNERKDFRRNKK